MSKPTRKQKLIRKEFPKVRQLRRRGNNYYAVDLRRKFWIGPKWKYFTSRDDALKYAVELAQSVQANGVPSVAKNIANLEDEKLTRWNEQLGAHGKTIEDAVEFLLTHLEKEQHRRESEYVGSLLTKWMLDRVENKLKPMRPRSSKSLRDMANRFKADFGDLRILDMTHQRIESYLQDLDVQSNQTRKNRHSYLKQFFNWCVRNKHLRENPADGIQIEVDRGAPEFFSVKQCQELMEKVQKTDLCGYFALTLFAGIRPEEASRLSWDHINADTREISIPPEFSKTKRHRRFNVSDNLHDWLEFCRDQGKPLISTNLKNRRQAFVKTLSFPWIQDGLRHTFCTFHYAKHHNTEELRHIMGNSPSVIDRFYKGAISQLEVEKFWGIGPEE
jgi:integrase